MAAITFELQGLQPLLKRMEELDRKVAKKAVRDAVRAGAKVLLDEAKAHVPIYRPRSGEDPIQPKVLKKSLGVKVKTYRKGTIVAVMGPRTGFKTSLLNNQRVRQATKFSRAIGQSRSGKTRYQNPTQYAHLAGPGRKETFMEEALAAGQHRAQAAIISILEAAIA
jgi:HK97 gp10 family phage protein